MCRAYCKETCKAQERKKIDVELYGDTMEGDARVIATDVASHCLARCTDPDDLFVTDVKA